MPLIFLRSKYNRIFPWFFPREIPWIDRNTNRVRFTPFAVHPLLRGRCNARGVDFTIFSDRFHYTGTSVPIRPRRLKNSSLRLSVPVLVLGNLEDIFMFGAGNRRPRVTGITVVSKRDFNEASNDFHCLQEKKRNYHEWVAFLLRESRGISTGEEWKGARVIGRCMYKVSMMRHYHSKRFLRS